MTAGFLLHEDGVACVHRYRDWCPSIYIKDSGYVDDSAAELPGCNSTLEAEKKISSIYLRAALEHCFFFILSIFASYHFSYRKLSDLLNHRPSLQTLF